MSKADKVAAELEAIGALGGIAPFGTSSAPATPLPDGDRKMLMELASRIRRGLQTAKAAIKTLQSNVDECERYLEGVEALAALEEDAVPNNGAVEAAVEVDESSFDPTKVDTAGMSMEPPLPVKETPAPEAEPTAQAVQEE